MVMGMCSFQIAITPCLLSPRHRKGPGRLVTARYRPVQLRSIPADRSLLRAAQSGIRMRPVAFDQAAAVCRPVGTHIGRCATWHGVPLQPEPLCWCPTSASSRPARSPKRTRDRVAMSPSEATGVSWAVAPADTRGVDEEIPVALLQIGDRLRLRRDETACRWTHRAGRRQGS